MSRFVTYLRSPLFVWWDITYRCNLRCKQCYSNSGKFSVHELNIREVKEIIKQLKEMKVFYIYFLGGEPFLRKDFLEIARYCYEVEIPVMVNSNGWFIDEDMAKKIKEANIHHVRVSIDGATSTTHDSIRGVGGSFKRAIQAIKLLKRHEIPIVSVSPTIMQENFSEVPLIIDLAFRYGASEIQFVQLCSVGRGKQVDPLSVAQLNQLKLILTQKKKDYAEKIRVEATPGLLEEQCSLCWNVDPEKHIVMLGCQAGRSAMNIGADGLVMPCLLDRRIVGNLREQSLKQIWESAPKFVESRTVRDICTTCQYQNICSQECPVQEKTLADRIRKAYLTQEGGEK